MNGTPCRRAWLVLGTLSLDLEDLDSGYVCQQLDLGYPDPREVSSVRPDQDGTDDTTAYMGARVVTANISAIQGAGAVVDEVAASFAPFMVPSTRPVLHYVLDRPGDPERTLTLRPSAFSWPIAGPYQRDIQLSFVAPDPVCRDPNQQESTSWAGSSGGTGRVYPLGFNRVYPSGGSGSLPGTITTAGDVPLKPTLRIYGPVTHPQVTFFNGSTSIATVVFSLATTIPAGSYIEVDTYNHTAWLNGDRTKSVLTSLDWLNTIWPVLPVHTPITFRLYGTSTTGNTQCQAAWHDGFLT